MTHARRTRSLLVCAALALTVATGCQPAAPPEPAPSPSTTPTPSPSGPPDLATVAVGDRGAFLDDRYRDGARELALGEDESFIGASSDGARLVIGRLSDNVASTRIVDAASGSDVAAIEGACAEVTPRDTLFCVVGDWLVPDAAQGKAQTLHEVSLADGATLASREITPAGGPAVTRVGEIALVGDLGDRSLLLIGRSDQAHYQDRQVSLVAVERGLSEAWSYGPLQDVERAWPTSEGTVIGYLSDAVVVVDGDTGREISRLAMPEANVLAATDGFIVLEGETATAYDASGARLDGDAGAGGALGIFPQAVALDAPVLYDRATIASGLDRTALVFDADGRPVAYGEARGGFGDTLRRASDGGEIDAEFVSGVSADGTFLARTLVGDGGHAAGIELVDLASGAVLLPIDDDGAAGLKVRDSLIHLRRDAGTVVLLPGA